MDRTKRPKKHDIAPPAARRRRNRLSGRAAPTVFAALPRSFLEACPTGQVVPFGRKLGTLSEARVSRDFVRRAERVCAAARVRVEDRLERA